MLSQTNVTNDKLKLVILYKLRYENETTSRLPEMLDLLRKSNVTDQKINLITSMIKFCGSTVRRGDLFGQKIGTSFRRAIERGLMGVDNVFAQHKPLLEQILDSLLIGKLSDVDYPFISVVQTKDVVKPKEVIVFMVGGTTYEELLTVRAINANGKLYPNQKVILGGTCIHNSNTFLDEIGQFPQ